ncbi:hypothetical protein [Myxococcus sp. CA039A]|uniref:hypothetical protein n=1 Tax=Myxococcus sp. CA039A TaxID=2741737 RepID=UPI00157B59D0|nr:hypothetical protein [Myxococcus sp. CA039A]NTX54603.1 hypothetical protein [Myxococcus sp. CA039A]
MRKLFLFAVLLGGCATSGPKPVSPDQVPESKPEGSQKVASLTAAEAKALGRIQEDAQRLLFPVKEGGAVCQYTPQAIGVTIYETRSRDWRYVIVGYNPDNCPTPETFPILHKSLAYLLAPDGKLLGPRVRGR